MKKLIQKLSAIIIAAVMTTSISIFTNQDNVQAAEISIEIIDNLLRQANTPESKIQEMDEELKRFIYENSLSQGEVEYINVSSEHSDNYSPKATGYTIPSSDLKLSVSAFKVTGSEQVDIYPSYEWLVPTQPKGNDYFAYSVHDSFSAVPDKRSNRIWSKLSSGDSWSEAAPATYTGTSMTGYEHFGDDLGTPDFPIYIMGSFYYRVDIDSSSPVKKIVLAYVHDTSWNGPSFGVNYKALSISITPTSSDVGFQNKLFTLDY